MTDNICHSILKTATQQIIQSAGFEAANNQSIEALTDIFGKYIELLGSTVSAYANLNNRTLGNERDLVSAFDEVSLDAATLKGWLEEDGKALAPCWSAQSDPSRLLQGVINGGKPNFEDIVEYKYGYVEEFEIPSPTSEDLPPSPVLITESLPDYIPSYFPPFPEIKEDIVMDEADKILLEKQQHLEEQKQKQQQLKEQAESLPLPVVVKKRKKPIENPFTHIIPFEESTLASENEDNQQLQQKPLSLCLKVEANKRNEKQDEEEELMRRKAAVAPLLDALQNVKPPTYEIGEGLTDKDRLFIQQAQDSAAPGNHLFNQDAGIFDNLVRHIADPLAISKLTAPNLLIDVATTTSTTTNNSPSATPHHMLYDYASPGSSLPTSPEGPVKVSRSSSMLAVLAGGSSQKKAGLKKLNNKLSKLGGQSASSPMSLSAFTKENISKSSIDINAFKGGDSKYIIKKKRMLAEQELAAKRQKLLEEGKDPNEILGTATENSTITITNPTNTSNFTASTPSATLPSTTATSLSTPKPSLSVKPINATSASTSAASSVSKPPVMNNGSAAPKPKGPISLNSFSSSANAAASSGPSTGTASASSLPEKEKKKKVKKIPNLMLNLSQNPVPSFTPSEENTSSPSTPKIRFKVKAPEPDQSSKPSKHSKPFSSTSSSNHPIKVERQNSYQLHLYQQPLSSPQRSSSSNLKHDSNTFASSEEIRCICENPTVDYGTFMIACDNCSVWYHGSCVGIAESDQVEEWYCRRCKRKLSDKR